MTLNKETLAIAIAVVTMLIALGQLLIMLPRARTRKAKQKSNWRFWRILENGTMWWLLLVSIEGVFRYALKIESPTKWDIYWFGASILMGAVWYCLMVARAVLRRNATRHYELQERVDDLENRLLRTSDMHSLR